MSKYEQYKDQYISKYDILTALWEQQKYGSVQDSKGRAKAILTIMDFPFIINVLADWQAKTGRDIFFPEEDEMIQIFRDYVNKVA